ncbi:GTP 3',8-cyclase MoaA [Alteromonas sp. 14N.309.X.WAT.G.H12]|uniref:GTP 3',8-cyclase MoaA n=1 Tax=Alteromonas sp. 14N.309.X.WAT.G.H12 TaxID=3120824 RepID=UPI002FD73F0D
MLQDSFGRKFHYLRLSVTEACNFKCQYCLPDGYQGPSESSFLTVPEIRTLVTAFARLGTSKIRITGGEPSLRRDFPEIIALCRNTAGIKTLATTTHGGRLAKDALIWKEAGLDQVNVSIDSLDPRLFADITGQNKLTEILKGVDRALEVGLKVKVNTVLLKGFAGKQLQEFKNWLVDTPVTLRFIELMETGDHPQFFNQQHLSGLPFKAQILDEGWTPVIRTQDAGPAEEFHHPDYAGRIGLILPYSKDFCSTCNRLRVAANGKLHLCLFSEYGIDIRPWLKAGDVNALMAHLQRLLGQKHATHYLHEGNTGATSHLAMLGG